MSNCPVFYSVPGEEPQQSLPPSDRCAGGTCNCGYLQYEALLPYLKEIQNAFQDTTEKYLELEFKLRQEIIEVSRIFDMEAGVAPGFFSSSHYASTKVYRSNGTRFLKVPEFVPGTLEVRTLDNYLIPEQLYRYQDGHLTYLPCRNELNHSSCEQCSDTRTVRPTPWPQSCYQISARWGAECSNAAVQRAIREYLIESYRVQDPIKVVANGISVARVFRKPPSWEMFIENFKQKRAIFSQFAIA